MNCLKVLYVQLYGKPTTSTEDIWEMGDENAAFDIVSIIKLGKYLLYIPLKIR